MPILAPIPNRFNGIITNLTGQPVTTWGTSVTPNATANTYGSYANVISSATAYDTYFMEIWTHSVGSAGNATDTIITVGIDPAGGTSYTDRINHLIVSCAGTSAMGAIPYQFPLFVAAGSTVGVKASQNRASGSAFRVGIRLHGKPTKPELVRYGTYVTTFGATTASSSGTAITPGQASEGTVVTLGTNITSDYWWWQGGVGVNDSTMTGGGLYWVLDIGIGTSTSAVDWIFQDQITCSAQNTSEQTITQCLPYHCYIREVAQDSTTDVYARMQASGAPDSSISAIAYGLGG